MRVEFYADDLMTGPQNEGIVMKLPDFIIPQIGSCIKIAAYDRPRQVRMICHDLFTHPDQPAGVRIWLNAPI